MQDLNEDLDDLFRHAVDKYALKPVVSKWDDLSGRIISIKRPRALADTIRSKYRKWMLLVAMIILFPIAILSVMTMFKGYKTTKVKAQRAAVPVVIKKNTTEIVDQKANTEHNPVSKVQDLSVKPSDKTSEKRSEKTSGKPDETLALRDVDHNKNDRLTTEIKLTGLQRMEIGSTFISETAIKSKPIALIHIDDLSVEPEYSLNTASLFEKGEPLTLHLSHQKNLPLQHLDYPRRQGFYLGLVAGPMLTQVKHQGLNKSGFDFGLLAGYTFSKKISIETGMMYTKQYYYVTGKYYNEFASVTNVTSLEGNRNAFEIPLTIKYNVIRRPGGNFFVSAGASSYVGVNDKIRVNLAEGAIPPSVHFDYGVTSWLPSYLSFSLGYEYKIGKFADIRIEPYFQVPLNSNTGNSFKTASSGGSIQVFNTGIHIGITRFIR